MVDQFYERYKCSKLRLIQMVVLAESSYYRKVSGGKKGLKPSINTKHSRLGNVNESEVIKSIKAILNHPFIDCGYRLMTSYLVRKGYQINHKKVYRIMKQAGLLKLDDRIKRSGTGRKFVKYRKVLTNRPFQCIEMDIKYVWVPSRDENAYLLSIIDVHTRRILKDILAYKIKKNHVINFLSELFEHYNYPENVIIRSDNGSQFIAHDVRDYLSLIGVEQEFTHVATPEENAHIEAYHGILKKDVFDRLEYTTFEQIQQILKEYVIFYNNERLHGLLGRITPMEKWNAEKHLIFNEKKIA